MSEQPPFKFTPKQEEKLLQWVEWLNTTYHKQGREMLRIHPGTEDHLGESAKHEGFCCLGIYGIYRKPNNWNYDAENMCWELKVGKDESSAQLPEALSKELGLRQNTMMCHDRNDDRTRAMDIEDIFVRLNDQGKQSFQEIADEILYILRYKQFSQRALDLAGVLLI